MAGMMAHTAPHSRAAANISTSSSANQLFFETRDEGLGTQLQGLSFSSTAFELIFAAETSVIQDHGVAFLSALLAQRVDDAPAAQRAMEPVERIFVAEVDRIHQMLHARTAENIYAVLVFDGEALLGQILERRLLEKGLRRGQFTQHRRRRRRRRGASVEAKPQENG